MKKCEICNRTLRAEEVITCDPCAAARIRGILGSRAWMKHRGSVETSPGRTLAEDLRAELAALEVAS